MYVEIDGSAVIARTKHENGSTWREEKQAIVFKFSDMLCRKIKREVHLTILKASM